MRWNDHQIINPHWGIGASRIDFNFKIPDELPQAQYGNSKNRIASKLKAEKELDGVDLNLEFDLPAIMN